MATVEKVVRWLPLIRQQASMFGLDPLVLAGLVAQESGGNPNAMRVESGWRYHNLDLPRPATMSRTTEWWGQATSWGLCQVMGTVARELGFNGWWPVICAQPDIGLYYGAKQLARCLKAREGDLRKGLLRYNGGGVKSYPARVLGWAKKIGNVQSQEGGDCDE